MSHNGSADRTGGRSHGAPAGCTAGHLASLSPAWSGPGVFGQLGAVFNVSFRAVRSDVFVVLVGIQDRLGSAGSDTEEQGKKKNDRLHGGPMTGPVTVGLR
jgi:hypothetical protein